MKKKNFKVKQFGKPKVTHETKHADLITQYNRMRSIAADICNSDFFAMASKKEQKEIEASVACISKTLVSMIGLNVIGRTGYLPDDSGDDRSWSDSLPDDSGNDTDINKERHDAIKQIMNIAYGKTKTNGVIKAAAKRALNSVYGTTGSHDAVFDEVEFTHTPYESRHINDRATSIMAMNRKILSELGKEHDKVTDGDSDTDEVKDYSEVNLGNFIEGPSYGWQYLDICRQCGFDAAETLKQIEKVASQYYIQMINLVDIVDSQDEITADKYTLEPGSVFFVTNKNDESKSPVFMLIYAQPYTKVRSSDITKFSFEIAPAKVEESTKSNYIDFVGSDAYYDIGKVHLSPNTVIDLDVTLEKIKDEARMHGIDTITFVGTIECVIDICDDVLPVNFTEGKYTLEPGSLFCHRGNEWLNFMLVVEDEDTPDKVHVCVINPVGKPEEHASLDDIDFVGSDAYYSIDNTNPNYVIDLNATLIKIEEKAKEKGIKTITFVDSIDKSPEIFNKSRYSLKVGSLFYIKNCIHLANFVLVTETGDTPSDTRIQVIKSVVIKKDDPKGETDSKEDDIEAADAEDKETAVIGSHKSLRHKAAIIDRCISDQYANVDVNEISCGDYAKVSFPIFMKPTMSGKNINFVDICNIYNFDVSETIKRIKNVAYLAEVGAISYVDTIYSIDEIFRETANGGYLYDNGSLFLMTNCSNAEKSPYFVILRKLWDDYVSEYVFTLYRVNPIMKSAKINSAEEIDVIDKYADGNVRIVKNLKNIVSIDFGYKIREICEERNYDYNKMISCIMGVIAIIGGGSASTFEGTADSINSIISVDPMVAYNTCSIFFVNDFVGDKKKPYFVVYMPITGKTKSGHNFRLYRICPIPKQDPNTDSQDDSNVREIGQITSIYRANSEVSEADKDAYMKVEFSLINHIANGVIDSLQNICYTWKFNFYDTIKRIRLVAYMTNLKEIKFAGTVCSHEEILEKEVLYSDGSVMFVSDEEDPHFVIVEIINGSTWLNRINPVKE